MSMAIRDILDSDFLLFGGKGGVGKTTCAAATGIALLPRKTLLVSTDPAHSLGDCLGQKIGDEITRVESAGNLYALEVSPNDGPAKSQERLSGLFLRSSDILFSQKSSRKARPMAAENQLRKTSRCGKFMGEKGPGTLH